LRGTLASSENDGVPLNASCAIAEQKIALFQVRKAHLKRHS
jgi:hypothetical protein